MTHGILPECPRCGKGTMLPFSRGEDTFELWKCSNPECSYTVNKR